MRVATDTSAATFDPTDARAAWTIEWCVAGSINYVDGHPGGGGALFAISTPPSPGEPRRYDVRMFGATPTMLERWTHLFAAAGLVPGNPPA